MLSFGQRLKAIRKGARLTQMELAEKLMVSVQAVSKWECGTSMPDISQITALAAVLEVTTDCLLGAGGDEKADREQLFEKVKGINKGIDPVYSRSDNAYRACYMLYREHIGRYPLDYEVRLLCADSLVRWIYYGAESAEEKDRLYGEAAGILKSLIHCDRDTTRGIDARQLLIMLYLYHSEFAQAEAIAEELPQRGNIRALMEIEICSKKNEQNACLAIAERMCRDAAHDYLHALAVKARRVSLLGDAGKQEVMAAWQALIRCAKYNYEMLHDMGIHTKWLYSACGGLASHHIAVSEFDRAFEVIEELTDTLIEDYEACRACGDAAAAADIRSNFGFYLRGCYNGCFPADENVISGDPRFQRCKLRLDSVEG